MIDVAMVCDVVARQLGRDAVSPELRLIEDLGAESLDFVSIALALEKTFSIVIADDQLFEVDVVGDFARLLNSARGAGGR